MRAQEMKRFNFSFQVLSWRLRILRFPASVDLPDEQWKTVEQDYSVSNKGRIKNKQGFLLKCHSDKRGYVYKSLGKKTYSVHRLVAQLFIDQIGENMVINHKDGNKGNNDVSNLEIVSQSQNVQHAYNTGLNVKINKREVYQVDYRGEIVQMYDSLTSVENCTGINRGLIHNAIKSGCTSNGYRWFKGRDEIDKEREYKTLTKNFFKVIQCDCETHTIIAVYDSYPQATNSSNVSKTNISRSCKTTMKAGGYKWFQCYDDYLNYKW